jgi:hypothetical protein
MSFSDEEKYKEKYLKYKSKYIELKQHGGAKGYIIIANTELLDNFYNQNKNIKKISTEIVNVHFDDNGFKISENEKILSLITNTTKPIRNSFTKSVSNTVSSVKRKLLTQNDDKIIIQIKSLIDKLSFEDTKKQHMKDTIISSNGVIDNNGTSNSITDNNITLLNKINSKNIKDNINIIKKKITDKYNNKYNNIGYIIISDNKITGLSFTPGGGSKV